MARALTPADLQPFNALARLGAREQLWLDCDARGPAMLPVLYREPHDAYETVGAIWANLSIESDATANALDARTKILCQLAASLSWPLEPFGQELIAWLEASASSVREGPVPDSFRLPVAGQPIDRSWMLATSPGNYVAMPLGVAMIDASGNVFRQAKVAAR
ncbi:MAG: hypothetical protein AAF950_16315 [Pseudomonadota bacterium]